MFVYIPLHWLPRWLNGKEFACNAGDLGWDHPWVGKIPWRRKWQPTPVFLLGEFHGQRSLVSYSPWGHKESDVTEWLTFPLAFIYSPTEDYLSCFQVLAIMNKHQCVGFCVDISFQLFQVEFSFKIRNSRINVDKFNFFTSIYTLDFKNKSCNSHWENTIGPLKSLLFVRVRARMHEVF